MEPTQNKPTKARRRWQIVTFVLLLVSLFSWWYWPRGDARFVGKWEIVHFDGNNGPFAAKEFWTFESVDYLRRDFGNAPSKYWTWRVHDKSLLIAQVDTGLWARIKVLATKAWNAINGRTNAQPAEQFFEVTKLTSSDLEFEDRRRRPPIRFKLKRIPE